MKLALFFILISSQIYAQTSELNKISVDAFREEKNTWTKTSSSYEIDEQAIEDSQQNNLGDILKDNPALNIVSQGTAGSNTSIFLRGLDEDHVMIMIDGVIVNDPSSPNRSFNIGQLGALNIEKIEVLPGSQGFLHGSDAIAGVINIVTKSPMGNGGEWSVFAGGPLSYGGSLAKDISNQKNAAARISVNYLGEDAISSADEDLGNLETDSVQRIQANLKGFWEASSKWTLDYAFQYSNQQLDIDRGGGFNQDDPNAIQNDILMNSKAYLRYSPSKQHILKMGVGYNYTNRETENLPDANDLTDSLNLFTGHRVRPEMIYEFQNRQVHVLAQAHYSYEQADFFSRFGAVPASDYEADSATYSGGVKVSNPLRSRLLWEAGARYSGNPDIDSALTYLMGLGYRWKHLKLRASYSTGFKTPSLFQLFDPQFGNPNLDSEQSQSAEIGMEYRFSRKTKMSLNIFNNQVDNLIGFGTGYINTGVLETSGVEVSVNRNLNKQWSLSAWGSYFDITSDSQVLRKPSYKLGGKVDYQIEKWGAFAKARLTGERDDFDFANNQAVELDSYLLVDIGAHYQFSKSFKVRANLHNLLNADYNEVFGYTTKGINMTVFLEGAF